MCLVSVITHQHVHVAQLPTQTAKPQYITEKKMMNEHEKGKMVFHSQDAIDEIAVVNEKLPNPFEYKFEFTEIAETPEEKFPDNPENLDPWTTFKKHAYRKRCFRNTDKTLVWYWELLK